MRWPSSLALALAVTFLAGNFARAASFQIGNGSLTATASSPPDNSDTPTPILLSSTNTSGSLSASSTSTDGYYITGSISVNVSLDSGTFDYSFTGESGANFINHSYADGTSTLDVYFTLTTPAVVELSELIGTPPDGPTYSYGSATLLDSGNNVLASIAGGFAGYPEPTPVFASLSTGTYQFQAELNTTPSAGTGGLAGGDIDLSIAPEPTTFLLLAPFLLMTRRPRTNRGFKPWPILRAASRGQPFPSSAHKDYSPP